MPWNAHQKGPRKGLVALFLSSLLLVQQGASLSALGQTVTAAPKTGSRVTVVAPIQPAGGHSSNGLWAPTGSALSNISLAAPGAPLSAPAIEIAAEGIALPAVAAAPAVPISAAVQPQAEKGPASSAERLTAISADIQPDIASLSRKDLPSDQASVVGEQVMAKALGQQGRELPVLSADVASPADASASQAASLERRGADSWWKDAGANHAAVTVPIYSLRRENNDPGIGKYTDLGTYYRDTLAGQGADVVHLLPHFAVLDESPYAPVSLFALNEDYIDWAEVREVKERPDLMARLVVTDLADQQAVNYKSLRAREGDVAQQAYLKFAAEHLAAGTARGAEFRAFVKQHAGELQDYAEYMALAQLINKPSLQWTKKDEEAGRKDPAFSTLVQTRLYSQWNAFSQFRRAMDTVHAAGGKVIFDIPMFRGKNSVDAWKHGRYFTDLMTRNPGVKNQWVHEDWTDLALWNWTNLKAEGYRPILEPFSYWLDEGFDGGRVDALHFAYHFGNGQLASGDEPGDDYVSALAGVFKSRKAFPLAEAFEGKAENALRFGFVTVYGDWKKLSSHDDPRSDKFMEKFLGLSRQPTSGRAARFVGYTLGDEWNDPVPVKRSANGRSYWNYRIPLSSDPDFTARFRGDARPQLGGYMAAQAGNVWEGVSAVWKAFKAAADTFVKHFSGTVQIWAASMDWFLEEWGRDTFISHPGLLVAAGRYDEAKENMRNFAKYEHQGLIPNKIWDASRWSPQKPDGVDYNTVDGSLWFIQAVKKYVDTTGDWVFAKEMLPVLRRVVKHYAEGTGYSRYGRFNRVYMDADGLIVSPGQATWMDADPEGRDQPVTPRHGKAVEINALWYAGLRFLARVETRVGDKAAVRELDDRAELAKKSFNDKFWFVNEDNKKAWGETGGALADVIEGDPHSLAIRPNMLFAVSHGEDLLTPERRRAVVLAATKDLLTPYGMRTLSYRDSNYHALYETWKPPLEKDQAYHQGTVWPWLMGAYADALARVRKEQGWDETRIREELRGLMTPLVEFLVSHPEGSLPEVFDGGQAQEALQRFSLADPLGLGDVIAKLVRSQNRGGTRSQAWSVAETMRVLWERGLAPKPD
ncbi:MAG: 4-alpha-glucanotransferase [Elusimicrobia bacterium]|nr:4-alpha-glucanotransferase [Elusimicrobiota bacterium]